MVQYSEADLQRVTQLSLYAVVIRIIFTGSNWPNHGDTSVHKASSIKSGFVKDNFQELDLNIWDEL